MVLHAPMQRQTFEESGCFEVGTYLKREMSTNDPAFHSHSSRTSPGPTPAVPGCPGEGAGEGTAEEETWPCQQRGDGCTYCGEGVLCGQCVCVCVWLYPSPNLENKIKLIFQHNLLSDKLSR